MANSNIRVFFPTAKSQEDWTLKARHCSFTAPGDTLLTSRLWAVSITPSSWALIYSQTSSWGLHTGSAKTSDSYASEPYCSSTADKIIISALSTTILLNQSMYLRNSTYPLPLLQKLHPANWNSPSPRTLHFFSLLDMADWNTSQIIWLLHLGQHAHGKMQ